MAFQNARYCNGFPTFRRNSNTLDASVNSTISDVFSLFPYFPVTKMVTVKVESTYDVLQRQVQYAMAIALDDDFAR